MLSTTLPLPSYASALRDPAPPPPPHPAEKFVENFLTDAESLARREPAKTVAVALAAGIFLNVIPTRFIVASVTAVTVTVLRPTLLTLGVIKAFEMCCNTKNQHPNQS